MKLLLTFLAANLISAAASNHALAADVLAKMRDTGKVTMGVRDTGAPLSYLLSAGEYAGYHVELCQRVLTAIQKEQGGKALAISYQAVTSTNRIPLVQNGTVDIECGTTTNNIARQKDVSFALTTFLTEIRMVVRANAGINSMAQLKDKNVAVTAGSTGVRALRGYKTKTGLQTTDLVGRDHGDSFLMLESGRADAFIIDDNIGAGSIALSKNPTDFKLTGEVLAVEPISIMLPKDDATFQKEVNKQIRRLMTSGEMTKLYDKWFVKPIPPKGIPVKLLQSASLKTLFGLPNDLPAEAYIDQAK